MEETRKPCTDAFYEEMAKLVGKRKNNITVIERFQLIDQAKERVLLENPTFDFLTAELKEIKMVFGPRVVEILHIGCIKINEHQNFKDALLEVAETKSLSLKQLDKLDVLFRNDEDSAFRELKNFQENKTKITDVTVDRTMASRGISQSVYENIKDEYPLLDWQRFLNEEKSNPGGKLQADTVRKHIKAFLKKEERKKKEAVEKENGKNEA